MQVYDLVMLAVLAISTIIGLYKGLAWQVASIASITVSYFSAVTFSPRISQHFGKQEPLNKILAMLALYVVTSLAIWLVFRMVAGFIDRVKLKDFDRQIGALVGFAKGLLFCIVITVFVIFLSDRARDAVLRSRSGLYLTQIVDKVGPLLPRDLRKELRPYLDRLDERLDPDNRNAGRGLIDEADDLLRTGEDLLGTGEGEEGGFRDRINDARRTLDKIGDAAEEFDREREPDEEPADFGTRIRPRRRR